MEKEIIDLQNAFMNNLGTVKKIVVDKKGFNAMLSLCDKMSGMKLNCIANKKEVSIHSLQFRGITIEEEK